MATKEKTTREPRASATEAPAATLIDRQLERYRSMRDFEVTSEPIGKTRGGKPSNRKSPRQSLPFVIQKHAASHLHYDFRLGWNGVLKSWAVAKGPSYFSGDKRLAVQVEDHPIEYGGFEGIIPTGQYGGGTVMLWDQGTWEPQPGYTDVDESLRSGSLKFSLDGTKMKGKWTLIRMGGKFAKERKPNWLLIKEHDELERARDDSAITEDEPRSVVTGRSLDEIAANQDHVWDSKHTDRGNAWHRNKVSVTSLDDSAASKAPKKKAYVNKATSKIAATVERRAIKQTNGSSPKVEGTPREELPVFIRPQLATQSEAPPKGSGWVYELKLDGYRIEARKDGERVQLLTRTGLDWTHRMRTIAAEVQALPAESAIVDGEVVVLAEDGTTSFASLQAAFQEGEKKPLTYFAFDLLHLDGHSLLGLPLTERKALLTELLEDDGEFIRLSEHLETSGEVMFKRACELHAEGIIAKRAVGRYTSGRSRDWLKIKCIQGQEFVIGGFTLSSKGTHGVGALLLGYYQHKKLIYAGRVGTGFTQKTHRVLRDQLEKLRKESVPFDALPREARKDAIWVKPQLVAQIKFATWTAGNLLRQASFKGIREDKPAAQVSREGIGSAAKHSSVKRESHPAAAEARKATTLQPSTRSVALSESSAPVRLTHPDKILDRESRLTKRQLADYYWAVATHMLPQIKGRPVSVVRCPEGIGKPCFFQKHVSKLLPPGIESINVPDKKTGKMEPYITLSTAEGLAGLAQIGVLEVHPWGSRNEDLEHPDRIIVDLDPDVGISWTTLAASAAEVRKQLKRIGLESFLKCTGGKGLHVVVPIKPEHDWATVKKFSHAFVLQMEKQNPSLYVSTMSKAARKDRIYLDYLRNERGATAVAAFSPRARAGVPVALPLSWSDLKFPERPSFRVADFEQWRSRLRRDPWKQLPNTNQRLTITI
jgi:bifunctional non-homologous end joining protein LigD